MAPDGEPERPPIEADEPPKTQEEFIAQVQEYYEKRKGLENLLKQMLEDQAKEFERKRSQEGSSAEGAHNTDDAGEGQNTAKVGSNDAKYSAVADAADMKSSRDKKTDDARRPETTVAAPQTSTAGDKSIPQSSTNAEDKPNMSPDHKLEQHVEELNLNE